MKMIETLTVLRMLDKDGLLETDENHTRKEFIHEYAEQLITEDCSSLYSYIDERTDIAEYMTSNFEFEVIGDRTCQDMISDWWNNGMDEIEKETMTDSQVIDYIIDEYRPSTMWIYDHNKEDNND